MQAQERRGIVPARNRPQQFAGLFLLLFQIQDCLLRVPGPHDRRKRVNETSMPQTIRWARPFPRTGRVLHASTVEFSKGDSRLQSRRHRVRFPAVRDMKVEKLIPIG